LLSLAWPIVVSRSTQVVVGVGDAVMVSGLGEEAVAATTTGALNTVAVLILPMGVCFIVSSFAAQLFGKGDLPGARRYGFYGLGVAALTQAACMLGLLAVAPVVSRLDFAPSVRELMIDYLVLRLISGGPAIAIEALGNYYGGLGNTRLPMLISLATMVMDLLGNYMLIGGHLGAPALGVAGAALSSTISSTVGAAAMVSVFLLEGRALGAVVPKLHLAEFARMLKFGIPSGFNWFFEFAAFNFYINVVVAGLGTTALAAMMSVMQIGSVSFMPAFALASAGAILVGQSIGADAKDEVPRIVKLSFLSSAVWETLVGALYLTVPTLLLLPFAKDASAVEFLTIGKRLLMLSACWGLFDAAVNTLAEVLRAAGDTSFTLWARLAIAWLLFVPGSYFTVKHFGGGDVGAMLWLIAYLGVLAALLWWRFLGGAWRHIQLVDPAAVTLG
jgi:multidrug resistance protein, MATE family